MRQALLPLVLLAAAAAIADAAPRRRPAARPAAAGKSAPACGAKILPLVVGNTWTYQTVAAPQPPRDDVARIVPNSPKTIEIAVKAIDAKGADTVITLEEKLTYDLSRDPAKPKLVDHTVTSTITCNAKTKFEISPESFFFAGEPGGFYGLTFDKLERKKDTSWKLTNGTIGEADWREELVAQWTRQPSPGSDAKLGAGKLELERVFTPQQPEMIVTKLGSYRAEKLAITTSGRVTLADALAPEGKPCSVTQGEATVPSAHCELPANWINQLWLVDHVGLVQALNTYAQMYQLVEATLN